MTAPPAPTTRRPDLLLPTVELGLSQGLSYQAIADLLDVRGLARGDGGAFTAADVAELVARCDLDPVGVVGRYARPRRPARLPWGVCPPPPRRPAVCGRQTDK